jgi:hypothetical protein
VGLTLKRAADHPEMPAYLMRRYRFTTDPTIPKGRPHTILALHQDGVDADAIARRTGSRARTVRAYTSAHDEAASRSVDEWIGTPLTTRDVCALHGAWWARWGSG